MTTDKETHNAGELPVEALILECKKDKYKMGYAALRWAKEIKQKENLPEPIPVLIPRALREVLTKKVALKEIEALPMIVKVAPPPPPTAAAAPTPTLKVNTEDDAKETKAEKKESKDDK